MEGRAADVRESSFISRSTHAHTHTRRFACQFASFTTHAAQGVERDVNRRFDANGRGHAGGRPPTRRTPIGSAGGRRTSARVAGSRRSVSIRRIGFAGDANPPAARGHLSSGVTAAIGHGRVESDARGSQPGIMRSQGCGSPPSTSLRRHDGQSAIVAAVITSPAAAAVGDGSGFLAVAVRLTGMERRAAPGKPVEELYIQPADDRIVGALLAVPRLISVSPFAYLITFVHLRAKQPLVLPLCFRSVIRRPPQR